SNLGERALPRPDIGGDKRDLEKWRGRKKLKERKIKKGGGERAEPVPTPLEHQEGATVAAGSRHRWSRCQLVGGGAGDTALPPRSKTREPQCPLRRCSTSSWKGRSEYASSPIYIYIYMGECDTIRV
ncbi:unnamed protein product, partial [Ixodes pacificus]